MRILYYIYVLLVFCSLENCSIRKENIQDKFELLKKIDYSKFKNMSIINRKGTYFVCYNKLCYKIEKNILTGNIFSIENINEDNVNDEVSKKTINLLEDILNSFREIGALSLLVDEKENVYLTIPWYDACTYDFLKLSSTNTLGDIKKQYYKHLENDWYVNKECAEN